MGRKKKYRTASDAIKGNNKAQERKRNKFKETGFHSMEIVLSDTTQNILFSAMRKNGYPNYAEGPLRGKILDVSNYLSSVIRKVSIRKLAYGECKLADEIWFLYETLKHLRYEKEYRPSERVAFLIKNNYKVPGYFDTEEWTTDIVKQLSKKSKVIEIMTTINIDCYENGKKVKMAQLIE